MIYNIDASTDVLVYEKNNVSLMHFAMRKQN